MKLNITEEEYKDAYDCLLRWPLKKYGRLLHSGQWGDDKIDDYQTWAIEKLPTIIQEYNRERGMKFSSFALWRARGWIIYKYQLRDREKERERVVRNYSCMNCDNIGPDTKFMLDLQKRALNSLSEEDRLFIELRYGLNDKNVHNWKEMEAIYQKPYQSDLRYKMRNIKEKLKKRIKMYALNV